MPNRRKVNDSVDKPSFTKTRPPRRGPTEHSIDKPKFEKPERNPPKK